MMTETRIRNLLGTLAVGAVVLLTSGCLDRTPEQSGVFESTNAGESWKAKPDLRASSGQQPDVFPPLEVTAVAAHPGKPDRVFAGTEDDLYLSENGGTSWKRLTESLPEANAISVQDIATISQNADTVYVAGVSEGYGKVFRSRDGGKKFKAVFTGSAPKQAVNAVAFGPLGTVYIGDQQGTVYRSGDQGDSWERVFTTESPISALTAEGRVLYIGTLQRGVFRSGDGGDTFAAVSAGLRNEASTVWSLAMGSNVLYAGTQSGLYRTNDSGRTWRQIIGPAGVRGAKIQTVAVGGTNVFFASNAVVFRLSGASGFVPRQLYLARNVTDLAAPSAARVYAGAHSKEFDIADRFRADMPILGNPIPAGNTNR